MGSVEELKAENEALRKLARELSIFATHVAGGGSEMFKTVAGDFYADAELCRQRYDHRQLMMMRITERQRYGQ